MPSTIFAIEIAARTYLNDPFRQGLHDLIRAQPAAQSPVQKRWQYSQAVMKLGAHFQSIELGCWDYWPDHDKATSDFEMWTQGMVTEEGVRPGPCYEGPLRYLTFTMAFLIVTGSPTDQTIANMCNIPQADLWKRDTFRRVIQAVGAIDFANVRSDVLYLIPGSDEMALTPQDLALPKFEYLRRIVG